MTKLLKNLVAWLPREVIRDNLPKAFIKTGDNKCRVILDCAEVFIERPKSLDCQTAIWSDYKHHNTIRFLVNSFQIQEGLLLRFCHLQVHPRARTKSQMTKRVVKKTKEIGNLRIHVERARNWINNYRILKGTLPITMMQNVDEIVLVCAALCNIKNVLIQTKKIKQSICDHFDGIFIEAT